MTENQLIAKKQYYEAKKLELINDSCEDMIVEKVDAFRKEKEEEILAFEKSIRDEISSQKTEDLKKVDNYLELLNTLIEEVKSEAICQDAQSEPIQDERTNFDTVLRPTMSL